MKRIYCDFCNKEIDKKQWIKVILQNLKGFSSTPFDAKYDACPDCAERILEYLYKLEKIKGQRHTIVLNT